MILIENDDKNIDIFLGRNNYYVKKSSTLCIPNWGGVGSWRGEWNDPRVCLFSSWKLASWKAEVHKVSVSTFPLTPANIDNRLSVNFQRFVAW